MSLNPDLLESTLKRATQENGGTHAMGMRFYERLFEKYPQVRPLFKTPPEEQHKKLMASLGAIVAGTRHQDKLAPYLHAMGIRHLAYKTENDHYGAVAENLLAVLEEHLSVEGEFSVESKAAWQEAIGLVGSIMIEAANAPEKYRAELEKAGYQPDGFKRNDPQPWLMTASV